MIHHYTFDKPTDLKSLSYGEKKPVIILVYMKGCPYCDMIKPTWDDFKHSNVIDTIDINYEVLPQFNAMNTDLFTPANAFPYIKSNVMKSEHRGVITKDELVKLSDTSKAKAESSKTKKTAETKDKKKPESKKKGDTKKDEKKKPTKKTESKKKDEKKKPTKKTEKK
jgi:thiol-disulfide isomerase/thioredoxin